MTQTGTLETCPLVAAVRCFTLVTLSGSWVCRYGNLNADLCRSLARSSSHSPAPSERKRKQRALQQEEAAEEAGDALQLCEHDSAVGEQRRRTRTVCECASRVRAPQRGTLHPCHRRGVEPVDAAAGGRCVSPAGSTCLRGAPPAAPPAVPMWMRNMSPEMLLLMLLVQILWVLPGTGAAPPLSAEQLDTGVVSFTPSPHAYPTHAQVAPPPPPASGSRGAGCGAEAGSLPLSYFCSSWASRERSKCCLLQILDLHVNAALQLHRAGGEDGQCIEWMLIPLREM